MIEYKKQTAKVILHVKNKSIASLDIQLLNPIKTRCSVNFSLPQFIEIYVFYTTAWQRLPGSDDYRSYSRLLGHLETGIFMLKAIKSEAIKRISLAEYPICADKIEQELMINNGQWKGDRTLYPYSALELCIPGNTSLSLELEIEEYIQIIKTCTDGRISQ